MIGFLFPGQGSQYVGMGKDVYDQFPTAREIFTTADKILGYSISKICFEGPEDVLTRTLHAQPAIFTTSIAVLKVLQEKYPDIRPSFCAGLSLGEFTALVGAGSLGFEDGLKLVVRRAGAMEQAAQKNPGTMASVLGLSLARCQEVAQEAGCQVANINSPDQIVISGTEASIDKAAPLAEQKGAKRVIRLKVGGAFHSRLMEDAKQELESALANTNIQVPAAVFIPNTTAQSVSDPNEIKRLLALQLTSPVRWVETMERAAEQNLAYFLEIGPGKVLKGLAKKSQPGLVIEPCGNVDEISKIETLLAKT